LNHAVRCTMADTSGEERAAACARSLSYWLTSDVCNKPRLRRCADYLSNGSPTCLTVVDSGADGGWRCDGGMGLSLGYINARPHLLEMRRAVVRARRPIPRRSRRPANSLPGIGPTRCGRILYRVWDLRSRCWGGNVERVMARHLCIHTPLTAAKPRLMARAEVLTPVPFAPEITPSG